MSLRLRYHNDESNPCMTVFTMEPQHRSILLYQRLKSSYGFAPMGVPFPHLVFILSYRPVPGGFMFPGVYGIGLRVLASPEPITSYDDKLAVCPTEYPYPHLGVVCTDHRWDNVVFPDVETLTGTIIDLWWNTIHYVLGLPNTSYGQYYDNAERWGKLSIAEVMALPWDRQFSLRQILEVSKNKKLMLDQPVKLPSVLGAGPEKLKKAV
jgi:hypothetical protein